MKSVRRIFLMVLSNVIVTATCAVAAERPFYQGKNVIFLINFAAGGPTDIEGRIVARHLAKHIAGNPAVIVQNMAGAGGVTGINFLGEAAKRDALTLGYFTGPYNHQMMKSPSLRIDLMKVPFIASVQGVTVCYIRADVPPGIKKPTDIAKAERFRAGGLSWRSTCSASSTITSPVTTAATTLVSPCSATKFNITTKIFPVTAASSSRSWSRPALSRRSTITI